MILCCFDVIKIILIVETIFTVIKIIIFHTYKMKFKYLIISTVEHIVKTAGTSVTLKSSLKFQKTLMKH